MIVPKMIKHLALSAMAILIQTMTIKIFNAGHAVEQKD
jgi:hypothetical protein